MDEIKRKKRKVQYTFFCFRLVKHFIICVAGFCVGLSSETFGTNRHVLQTRHSLTDFELDAIQFSSSFGMILGVVAAGIIFWHYAKYTVLIVACNVLNVSATLFAIPWISQIHVLCIIHAGMGASGGFMVTAGNTGVTLLWREYDATSWLHCLHFFVAMGALVTRHTAIPFIYAEDQERHSALNDSQLLDCNSITTQSATNSDIHCNDSLAFLKAVDENITPEYPISIAVHYSILGVFVFMFAMTALSLFLYGQPNGFPTGNKAGIFANSMGIASRKYTMYTVLMLLGFTVFLLSALGGLETISASLTDNDYPPEEKLKHISNFSYSIAIGRLLAIFVTRFIKIDIFMTIELICIVCLTSVRCSLPDGTDTTVWTVFTGAFIGLTLPSAMSFASKELHMNSVFVLVLLDAAFVGSLCSKHLIEYLLDTYGSDCLIVIMSLFNVIMLTAYVLIHICSKCYKPKSDTLQISDKKIDTEKDIIDFYVNGLVMEMTVK